MGNRNRVRPTDRVHSLGILASNNLASFGAGPLAMLATLATAAAALAFTGCATTSPTAQTDRPIQEIENERNPIVESDCLEGEYFDSATESCESLESQK